MPASVAAAFEDLNRVNRRHALTTDLLRSLHELLGARISQRADLLVEQLSSPEPGVRLDAIRMTSDLVGSWRGDHSTLIRLVAAQLAASNLEVAAEAATLLERHYAIAEPTREILAALLSGHGPHGWATPQLHLRDRLRHADLSETWPSSASGILSALAKLGDPAALPMITETLVAVPSGGTGRWCKPRCRRCARSARRRHPRSPRSGR